VNGSLPDRQTSPVRWLSWLAASSAPLAPPLASPTAYIAAPLFEEGVQLFHMKRNKVLISNNEGIFYIKEVTSRLKIMQKDYSTIEYILS